MRRTVVHFIIGLGKGGAETMLYQVLKYSSAPDIEYKVVSLGASHYYEPFIRELEVELVDLNLRRRPFSALWKTIQAMRGASCLCCWMYHCNYLGYYIAKLMRVPKLVWCIRHSKLDPDLNKKLTLWINRQCAKKSHKVDIIAYNGRAAMVAHENVGYSKARGIVLENGCDSQIYKPVYGAALSLRNELGIRDSQRIILSVTKYHPIKGVSEFIQAFRRLHSDESDTVAVLCGSGIQPENKAMQDLCRENNLAIGKDVFLLGMRHDIPKLLSSCDLFVLHSIGEAFPNTLVQAMSCGCLCIATDVGDVRRILAQEDQIVPAANVDALYRGMRRALDFSEEEKTQRRAQNRERVMECYDIREIVKKYEELFE